MTKYTKSLLKRQKALFSAFLLSTILLLLQNTSAHFRTFTRLYCITQILFPGAILPATAPSRSHQIVNIHSI